MMKSDVTLSQAVAQFDRSTRESDRRGYQSQRAEILKRFPRDKWPDMALEDYALGLPAAEDTYCRWLEFRAPALGGIRGGAAKKHIIYKPLQQEGWYFPRGFSNEREAWNRLRSEFVQAFELAERGDWERIDELETLARGPALKLKSLHVHFPDQVLPVYSTAHLRHFLRSLDRPSAEVNASSVVALNHFLLAALRREPEVADWNTEELPWLLYDWRDPRPTRRVLKIEPGRDARFWNDCRREGYVCVGWDDVGDLSAFESKEAFRIQFEEAYPYDGRAQARRKDNELWKLRELEPGDLVVANRGTGRVLAVGEVVEPGYRWAAERPEGRHTVAVKWDGTRERSIPPQARWAKVTVATVSDPLLRTILDNSPQPVPPPVPPAYPRIASALDRKGQLILYGPPGTGKTYQARRFAVWWLSRQTGREGADAVLVDADRLREAERELSTSRAADSGTTTSVGPLTRVTFHPSYTYEDFIEGFRPADAGGPGGGLSLALEDGVFKRVCRAAQANPDRPYLLLIDEINRGNVAKIMGELLTLIERDKRGLTLTLPQSKETFSVPPNVFLLGTMNTADRSIKLLDAALRRRFAFIECMPDSELVHGAEVGDLALDEFLDGLNQRIARLEGREKQVGHSYLLVDGQPVDELEEFAARFREEILPLLQEYCYDEYATLAKFIGSELVDADAGTLDAEKVDDAEQLVAALAREFGEDGGSTA